MKTMNGSDSLRGRRSTSFSTIHPCVADFIGGLNLRMWLISFASGVVGRVRHARDAQVLKLFIGPLVCVFQRMSYPLVMLFVSC